MESSGLLPKDTACDVLFNMLKYDPMRKYEVDAEKKITSNAKFDLCTANVTSAPYKIIY